MKHNMHFSKTMISRKMMTKICAETLKRVSTRMNEKGFKKDLPALPPRSFFFMFILLISGSCNFSEFLKNSLVQINFTLYSKLYNYLHKAE